MNRRYMVIGNWKMHGSKQSVNTLLSELKNHCEEVEHAELVVLPPCIFLPSVADALMRTQISWGAQNVANIDGFGALTGEISATMLKEFNCSYVLVGHSERRVKFFETNDIVSQKFLVAINSGLCPILCVGESYEERVNGKALSIVRAQLNAVLDKLACYSQMRSAVIAYEPVWAIGTGKQPSASEVQEMHANIRSELAMRDKKLAYNVRILYGGSVNPDNAAKLFGQPDVDGGLIGGASLQADQFLQIGMKCKH